jgi:hypothetical protein
MLCTRRLLNVAAVLAAMACFPASSLGDSSLYDVLTQYMDARKAQWDAPDGYRDRDVTEVICPLVTPELLEQMRQEHPSAVQAGLAAREARLPVGTRYWHITRDLAWLGFQTQTLSIVTNDGFCHAAYSQRTAL